MKNSVVVIFGLAAVLFVTDSDSAAARFVSEGASRAEDAVSGLAAALFDEGLNFDSPIASEESLPNHQRLHKRSSRGYLRQSGQEIDVVGLTMALKQLERQLAQVLNQAAASTLPYDPLPPLTLTRSNRFAKIPSAKIAEMAFEALMALANQLPNLPMFGQDSTQIRQSGAVPLPATGPNESGYPPSEIILPINPGNLPFNSITLPFKPVPLPMNPSTLPFDPATLPLDPVTLPLDPVALPFDPEGVPNAKGKPVSSTKPKSGPSKIDEPSSKPYSLEEDRDSPSEETDQLDNGPQTTRVVYENRMNDNPYNLIPAVLHLRMKKQKEETRNVTT